MDRHAWKTYRMPAPDTPMRATRQLTRQLARANAKKRRHAQKNRDAEDGAQALVDRVYDRQQAGKRPVQWPIWWRGRPTGVL